MDIHKIADIIVKAFVPHNDFAFKQNKSFKEGFARTFVNRNYIRIAVTSPLMHIMIAVFSYRFVSGFKGHLDLFFKPVCEFLLLISIIGFVVSLLILISKKNCCRIFYLMYWYAWAMGLSVLAYCPFISPLDGVVFFVTCIVVHLIPLLTVQEFIVEVILIIINMLFLRMRFDQISSSYITVLVAGFIAQRLEIALWVTNEYVVVTAMLDPLTGLLNRRGANTLCANLQGKGPFGVMIMDIDFFKNYNDTFGHDAGDQCLTTVASAIREAAGDKTEILIRHGGEEFVIVWQCSDKEELLQMAEKVRLCVLSKKLPAAVKKTNEYVSLSIGCTLVNDIENGRYETAVKIADKGLYKSKENGRNQVTYS